MPRIPDNPDELQPMERLRATLKRLSDAKRASKTDPLKLLADVADAQRGLRVYENRLAKTAMELGYRLEDVGSALGVDRSTAHRRMNARLHKGDEL